MGRQLRIAAYLGDERHEVLLGTLVSENFLFLRQAILGGIGVGIVPDYVVQDDIRRGTVVTSLDAYRLSIFGTHMYMLYMPNRHHARDVDVHRVHPRTGRKDRPGRPGAMRQGFLSVTSRRARGDNSAPGGQPRCAGTVASFEFTAAEGSMFDRIRPHSRSWTLLAAVALVAFNAGCTSPSTPPSGAVVPSPPPRAPPCRCPASTRPSCRPAGPTSRAGPRSTS